MNDPDDDASPRKDARTNPWYVLMTIAGEQTGGGLLDADFELSAQNQRYWNGWAADGLSDAEKSKLITEAGWTKETFAPLTEAERATIERQVSERCNGASVPHPKDHIDFRETVFPAFVLADVFLVVGDAVFENAVFLGDAHFEAAHFLGNVRFTGATFSGDASFRSAMFSRCVDFRDTDLSGYADFLSANFAGYASFEGTTFSRGARFDNAKFFEPVCFIASKFERRAWFSETAFMRGAPEFQDAKLPHTVTWDGIALPPVPMNRVEVESDVRAYERLKLAMTSQRRMHSAQMFLRKELACREALEGRSAAGIASRIFGAVSDYGWSVARPLRIGVGLWAVGAVAFRAFEDPTSPIAMSGATDNASLSMGQAMGLSFSNLFGFLGLGRHFLAEEYASLTAASEIVAVLQMICGPILLFLIGLALRNRFRLG